MKKLLIPALAVAVASAALPAAAQSYDRHGPSRGHGYEQNYGGWNSISQRKHNLDRRIDQGIRNHQLSRREASRLQDELNSLVRLERSYMRGGLTRWERVDLDRRYDRLSAKVRYERNDYNGRRH
jgi:Spy/CpxP family protein refolding chaperone